MVIRIPGAFEIPLSGGDNLKDYISTATLPPLKFNLQFPLALPPPGHKSHKNRLNVRAESSRRLQCMTMCNYPTIHVEIEKFIEARVPKAPLVTPRGIKIPAPKLTVPCEGFNIMDPDWPPIEDLPSLATKQFPMVLETAEGIMRHIAFKEQDKTTNISDWAMYPNVTDSVDDIMACYLWSRPSKYKHRPSLIIMAQPPWILSERDIQTFLGCRNFPSFDILCKLGIRSEYRVWGQLYDMCTANKTPWFVLTNYQSWVFGVFSRGWTNVFIVSNQRHDSIRPTVLETLLYWICSSMALFIGSFEDAFDPPELSEIVFNPSHLGDGPVGPQAPPSVVSESAWTGMSGDATSSAHVRLSSPSVVSSISTSTQKSTKANSLTQATRDAIKIWHDDDEFGGDDMTERYAASEAGSVQTSKNVETVPPQGPSAWLDPHSAQPYSSYRS
ncbi:hypothetical protein BV25DRAFT_1825729 [Artomyces pyxidatus]|uniref:Uncharacterized protein n=1 Tax=Artomyces pyxidatus TaxID=48021 RepID=A0ACB8T1E7_9AGAM|nr:hypothetical protein BV25DRAFT_1825729 [Artomyces pyxidatus]